MPDLISSLHRSEHLEGFEVFDRKGSVGQNDRTVNKQKQHEYSGDAQSVWPRFFFFNFLFKTTLPA